MVVCISVTCGNEVDSFSLGGNSMILHVRGERPSLPEGFNLYTLKNSMKSRKFLYAKNYTSRIRNKNT